MKIIDWYILKKLFTTFFYSIFLFTIIAVAIDVSEKTDDFVKSGLSFSEIVMQYYIGFIPFIIAMLFPLFAFIAVIFFTSKMALRTEIVAIIASGTSFSRFLRPYWIGGISLGLLLMVATNFYLPMANGLRTTFEARYVKGSYDPLMRTNKNIYFRIDSFTYAGVRNYDTTSKVGGPFFMHRIKDNELVYNLRAEVIKWDTAKNKWILQTLVERSINGLDENVKTEVQKIMNFNFKPYELSRDEYAKDKLTTPELAEYIKLESLRGSEGINSLKVEEYRRFATPVAVLILTLIGGIVASRKVRGGSGAHMALGIVLATLFILMDKFSTIFSSKGNLPPLIAAWIPNIVFIVVAFYLYRKAPK